MTDKEKIREEVERLMNELIQEKEKGFGSDTDDACILELQNVLTYIDSLEENNSTHRTPADIEVAMQEVEAKSEAYTNAHRGERADDVLSQMRGEPVSDDLEEAAKEYAIEQILCSTDTRMTEQEYLGIRLFNGYDLACAYKDGAENQCEQMMKNAVECEYFDGSLFRNDLREKYRDCDKVKIVIVKSE